MASGTRRQLYSGWTAGLPGRCRACGTCVSGSQIADLTSSRGRGWINVMQVMRINVRRSRADAGVQENPRREVELIPRQQTDESGCQSTRGFQLQTCLGW